MGGMPQHTGPPREAPRSGRRQKEGEESMGKGLYYGFLWEEMSKAG